MVHGVHLLQYNIFHILKYTVRTLLVAPLEGNRILFLN